MRRKAAALAVGALFMAPAAHAQIVFGNPQAGTLQIYGKLYPQFGYATSKDATQPTASVSTMVSATNALPAGAPIGTPGPRRSIDQGNSYIGFRGERDLTSYRLKFIWQLEQSVVFDQGTGTFASRNSFLGVRSTWGTVKLGNFDTIYKEYGDLMQMFGVASGNFVSASNMLSHIGVGGSNNARFHERRNNSIQFESPQVSGMTFGYQYSPDEFRDTNNTTAACGAPAPAGGTVTPNCGRDGSLHSYGVKWDSEKLSVSVHQEIHNDAFGYSSQTGVVGSNLATQGAHSRDTGTRLSTEWRYVPEQRIVFDIGRLKYREYGQASFSAAAPRFESYQHTNWAIGWDGGFGGPWRFAVQYLKGAEGACRLQGLDCSTQGLASYMVTAGARYRFDRQTFVYLIGAKLNNGPSAAYDNWSASNPARGADITQVALGLSYSF